MENSIITHFQINGNVAEITRLGSGHIHSTYLVKTSSPEDYVLQQVNTRVFRDPALLMNNIQIVTSHIREKLLNLGKSDVSRSVLSLVPTHKGELFMSDKNGKIWRCFIYIKGHKSYDNAIDTNQVYEGGKAYGRFLTLLSDLPAESLKETIRGFHNMALRLRQFDDARKNGMEERISESSAEIGLLDSRREEMMRIQNLGTDGKIPLRIVHHDTKINNVLFDEEGKGLCVIDLDTVMPGYVHDDFGDSIRTFTNTGEEDDAALDKIAMNMDFFKAYAEGYLEETRSTLTPVEKEYLALSAKAMTYMQCLRFLTDHLNGDIYYHINHEGHNLQRTRAQIRLLLSMEENFNEMEQSIRSIAY